MTGVELRQLEHFVAVAEEGSFTAAAARLYLAQSSLSSSLQALERTLGTDLFIRGRRGVEMTDAGRALLEPARATLRDADRARDAAAQIAGVMRGSVRIVTPVAVPPSADVIETIRHFSQEHPGVEIQVISAAGRSMVDMVVEGEVDFAVAPRWAQRNPSLRFQPLIRTPLALICPATHRLARATDVGTTELVDELVIDLPRSWQARLMFDEMLARGGVQRRAQLEVTDWLSAVLMVKRGLGLSYGPSAFRLDELFSDVAVVTIADAPTLEFGVMTRDDSLRGAAGRAFLAAFIEQHRRNR